MKILLVPSIYLPSIGGVQINTHELAKHLKKMGHEVIVLTSNWRKWELPFYEQIDDIRVYRLPFYVFRGSIKSFIAFLICFPISLIGILLCIRNFRPEIINIHFLGSNAFYILLVQLLIKIPLVITFHGSEVITVSDPLVVGDKGYTKTEAYLIKWATSLLLNRANYITAVSGFLLKKAEKLNSQIYKKSSRVFMSGRKFNHSNEDSLIKKSPFLLGVGRLSKEKGFDILIEALKTFVRNYEDLSLIIIGDGPDRDFLLKKVRKYKLEDRVILKGALPSEKIGAYYDSCLFLLTPSRSEGLPSVLWEAFSHGKTVIATSVGGIPEIVLDDFTGILVESEDIKQLAAAIIRLLNDTNLRENLEENVKVFMKEIVNRNVVAQSYCEIYHTVLNNR